MSNPSKYQVLLVDDEPSIRESLGTLLTASGYEVVAANNGFDALLQLKRTAPDVIISDLNMPEMSGFEFLSVVRRRFPQIPVVAISGAYDQGSDVPGGVIADAFYPKGQHHPKMLLETVADLIRTSVERSNAHRRESAPVWIPRNGKDSHGKPFIVLTCAECLRSFPLSVTRRRSPNHPGNAVLVLPKHRQVRYRFFDRRRFPSQEAKREQGRLATQVCRREAPDDCGAFFENLICFDQLS